MTNNSLENVKFNWNFPWASEFLFDMIQLRSDMNCYLMANYKYNYVVSTAI